MGNPRQIGALTSVHFPPEAMKAGKFSSAPPPPPASMRAGRHPQTNELGVWNKWGGFTAAGAAIGYCAFALIPAGVVAAVFGSVAADDVHGIAIAGLSSVTVWALISLRLLTQNPGSTAPRDPWRPHDRMD